LIDLKKNTYIAPKLNAEFNKLIKQ